MNIGYVRVSTEEQNTERQERLMQGLEVDKLYIEKASGKNADRKELKTMLDFARSGDCVVVESISRIARNTRDLLEIVEALNKKGIKFMSKKNLLTLNLSRRYLC